MALARSPLKRFEPRKSPSRDHNVRFPRYISRLLIIIKRPDEPLGHNSSGNEITWKAFRAPSEGLETGWKKERNQVRVQFDRLHGLTSRKEANGVKSTISWSEEKERERERERRARVQSRGIRVRYPHLKKIEKYGEKHLKVFSLFRS